MFHAHIAAHAQVADQVALIQGEMQVFTPPAGVGDGFTGQRSLEGLWIRRGDAARPVDLHGMDALAAHAGMFGCPLLEATDDGFNFW